MKTKLRQLWHLLTDSLWFIPGLLILSAMSLGLLLVELEVYFPFEGEKNYPLLFGVGAEGSRGMLSAIASSMLTVAGLSFTLTLSAISQVSSQYSPRLLRNFMSDRVNQFVMGYFTGSFAYCLIVLRTIRGGDEGTFVPSIAVLGGLLLALGGVLALILFIHHIAESMQAGTIVYKIMVETGDAIEELFPQELGEPVIADTLRQQAEALCSADKGWTMVKAPKSGYLQAIDTDTLLDWATEQRAIIRLEHDVGAFVGQGVPLLSVRFDEEGHSGTTDWMTDLRDTIHLERYRAVDQDVRFGIQQMVDVATSALSPSVNDTTTAIMAIEHLGVVMNKLVARPFPSPYRTDSDQLRIIARTVSYEEYISEAFDLIRISSKGNHTVFVALLSVLNQLKQQVSQPNRIPAIHRQIALVHEFANQSLATDYEKKRVSAF